jgi:hypothetical protein
MWDFSIIDPLLTEAAKVAGITGLRARLPSYCMVWVNPGLVQLQFVHNPHQYHVLYQKAPTSVSVDSCRPVTSLDAGNVRLVNKQYS